MTRFYAVLLAVLLSLTSWASKRDLTVMTFNIKAGTEASLDSIAMFIASHDPDFVALQEVDIHTNRSGHRNIISELAYKTGMLGSFARTLDYDGGYYGIGMLSKYPIIGTQTIDLPNLADVEPRVMLVNTYLLPDHSRISMACTHLSYEDSLTRLSQAQEIASYTLRHSSSLTPVLLAGDFNNDPGPETSVLDAAGFTCLTDSTPTFPADTPTEKLDYIFGYPSHCFSMTSTVVPDVPLSDHRPVISKIAMTRPIVLHGNSIAEIWPMHSPDYFTGTDRVSTGVSGETSRQICERTDDVMRRYCPSTVVIISPCTNDIAQNQGPVTIEEMSRQVRQTIATAKEHSRVILTSNLPCAFFPWRPALKPVEDIRRANDMLENLAKEMDVEYIDLYTPMALPDGSLNPEYTYDGCHPNATGFKIMEAILDNHLNR